MDANDSSKQGPEPEIGTENQKGPELEVTDGSYTSINVTGDNIGTEVISPGDGGSDDKSDGSTVLPSNPPLNGKALLYQQYLYQNKNKRKRKKKKEKKKRRTVLPSNHPSQCLYHDVFTTYLCQFLPNDLHLLKDIIQDIITALTSLPKRCTITPIAKFNLEVASWTTTCNKATTAGSSFVFEDSDGEDGLSFQLTYKVNIDCPYYEACIVPNQKSLNDLKSSKEQLKTVYGGIMKEVNELRLQIASTIPFLPLIMKAKPSILILPKFKPKMCLFGLLMILN
jgi:hypothetical protein